MNINIRITYDTVTPESAEDGDTADHGFYGEGGRKYSIADDLFQRRAKRVGREQALADMTPEPHVFETVEDAVEFLQGYGPFEASEYPVGRDGRCWLTQTSPSEDRDYFEKGEETRLSFHVTVDAATHYEIITEVLGK